MWWRVVCVLVYHFHHDMASLDEESEYPQSVDPFLKYDKILDFIDSHYGDVSEPEYFFSKHHKDRVRRRDDSVIPLTPMPKDRQDTSREIGATPLENYAMYTDHSEAALAASRKPWDHDFLLIAPVEKRRNSEIVLNELFKVPSRKITDIGRQDFSRTRGKQLKYFDADNPMKNYDIYSRKKSSELYSKPFFDYITQQATIGSRPIATITEVTTYVTTASKDVSLLGNSVEFDIETGQSTIVTRPTVTNQETTSTITTNSPYVSKETENDIGTVINDDVTELTRKIIDYHTTIKENTKKITQSVDFNETLLDDFTTTQIVTESTTKEIIQTPQTVVYETTWILESIATFIDTTTSVNYIDFENVSYLYIDPSYSGMPSKIITTTEAVSESSIAQLTTDTTVKPSRSTKLEKEITKDRYIDTYNSIATEENTKDTLKVITWEIQTENTLIDSTVSNEKASTESTTEVITTYDTGIENNFIFPQATVDMSTSAMKASDWKDFERRRKKTTTTTKPTLNYSDANIDIPKLLQILDYVVFDSKDRFNLMKKFNETLQNYTIPTCEPPTPTTEEPTEPPSTMNFNDANVVAKCFVCGLDVERVPYSTACADAFSGDFIPLVPIDPKARGQVAKFRKYCRYLDVNRVITKEDEPHSVFGRFTGGCSVRWVDLTSIYTQRTCRNRRRAVMGKHFGSKRMAKLEMALSDMDNGCIISPVATLLPVSRGISLYARFHACVCTGNWCNKAVVLRNWITNNVLIFIVVTYVN